MAENERGERPKDPEIERLKFKAQQGAVSLLEGILDDPKIRRIIHRAFVLESIKMGFTMGFLVTGLILLFNAIKEIMHVSDGALAVILLIIGIALLIWEFRK